MPMTVWSICSKPSDLESPKTPETKMYIPLGKGQEKRPSTRKGSCEPGKAGSNWERGKVPARKDLSLGHKNWSHGTASYGV
jgi:hypothetical protein